jgi:ABC-type polysaccharide/polyol phosphate export permease
MTGVISGWRWAMLGASQPDWLQTLVGVGACAALFVIGLTVFRISEPRFADTI